MAPAPTTTAPAPTTTTTQPPIQAAPRGATLGSTSYPYPSNAIFVSPRGSDSAAGTLAAPLRTVAAAIRKAPSGATIVLRAGSYHESVEIPIGKTLTLQNYPREVVWFDGSVPVTNWVASGRVWIANGWTTRFSSSMGGSASSYLLSGYPMARYPDQMFINGAPLTQVANAAEVGPGKFFADYANSRLIIGDNPSGKDVRASKLDQAIKVLGVNSVLRGFGVTRYASTVESRGAIVADATGGIFEQLVVSHNATMGLSVANAGKTITNVTATDNGMLGIGVNKGHGLTLTNSIISYNNAQYFQHFPQAGGVKITDTKTLRVENNEVRGNKLAMGIWLDVYCSDFTIVNNVLTDNGRVQVLTEISSRGIVANNLMTGGRTGIKVYDTDQVQVFNNHFGGHSTFAVELGQDARWKNPPRAGFSLLTKYVTVSNNVFGSGGIYQFYAIDGESGLSADAMAITITGNLFNARLSRADATMVGWGQPDKSLIWYQTPLALAQAKNRSWVNAQTPTPIALSSMGSLIAANQSVAAPLPSNVAAALRVPTGTKKLGLIG